MQDLTATAILDIWESGQGLTPAEQALLLLERTIPPARADERRHDAEERHDGEKRYDVGSQDSADSLGVGRRDALLFELRTRLFGSRLDAVMECPSCDRQLEMTLDIADLPLQTVSGDGSTMITSDGYELCFRSPTTRDLLAVRNEGTEEEAVRKLLLRCILEGNGNRKGETLSAELERAVADRIAETDPLTDLTFAMLCPLCDHRWNATFDIVSYLWMEIEGVAHTLLDDVHRLASSYGWSEAQILTLSDSRRAYYLALLDTYAEAAASAHAAHAGRRGLS